MSIDIFGRSLSKDKKQRGLRGPPGKGFNVTVDGHYDIEKRRLCNVGYPSSSHDAVTMEFVLKELSALYKKIINDQKEIISHLHSEVVTLETTVGDLKKDLEAIQKRRKQRLESKQINGGQEDSDSGGAPQTSPQELPAPTR